MKKIIKVTILLLFIFSGLVSINCENKNETTNKSVQKPLLYADRNRKAEMKKWEASPDGIMFKKWETSTEGKKVYASEAKIMASIKNFTIMEGVVTCLSLPPGSRLGYGIIANIKGEYFILSFGVEQSGSNEFQKLGSLKVNDKIIIKSHNVSHAPKYSFPIILVDYLELDGKILYKRILPKNGC